MQAKGINSILGWPAWSEEDNFLPCGFSIKGFMQFSLRTGLSVSCT